MFTLFPNATSPASALLNQHGAMILIAAIAAASIVVLILFGKPGSDGAGFSDASDYGDGSDGGDCSAD